VSCPSSARKSCVERLICGSLLAAAATFLLAPASAQCKVLAAHYDIKVPSDPGSATMLLRNTGQEPLRVERLLLDGTPLPCAGIGEGLRAAAAAENEDPASRLAAARIIWATLDPNPIPPGRSALLYVQFRHRPPYAFRLALASGETTVAESRLLPVRSPIRILNVAFTQALSACCIYVENSSPKAERVEAVELNDTDVTSRAWLSDESIPPGSKGLVHVPRPKVRVGQHATVLIRFASGARGCARVRALPVFPVVLERGGPNPALGIEAAQAHWEAPPSHRRQPTLGKDIATVRIFHCPAHLMGSDWQAAAAETLRRWAVLARQNPRIPLYSAVCRARASLSCPCFAHTTDAGFLNPYLPQYSRTRPPRPLDAVANALALARRANAPDPFYSLVVGTTFGDEKRPSSPGELRRLAYAVLAAGTRGVIYRIRPSELTDARAETLSHYNAALHRLIPLLLVAEPVDWASSSSKQVAPRVLLAGRDALLLFLLNAGGQNGDLTPAGPAEVTVRTPPWLAQLRLAPGSGELNGTIELAKRKIAVTVKKLASALVLVFRTEQPEGRDVPP
jgi:hypothetical protein